MKVKKGSISDPVRERKRAKKRKMLRFEAEQKKIAERKKRKKI